MTTDAPTVFVVDDDPSVRRSLGRLLASEGYQTGAYADPTQFLEQADLSGPGCLVLDLQLPGLNGLELQQLLRSTGHRLPIIFLTGHADIPASVRAMKAGAVDFLTKPVPAADLLAAVATALATDRRQQQERAELAEVRQRLATLTPREREVLQHVVTGAPNKLIAVALGAAEKTVKIHRARVMAKMQAASLPDLVRLAQRVGVIPNPADR